MPPSVDKDRTRARFSNVKRKLGTKRAAWAGVLVLLTVIMGAAFATHAMHGEDARHDVIPQESGIRDTQDDPSFPGVPADPFTNDDFSGGNGTNEATRNVTATFHVTNEMNESVLMRLTTRAYSQLEETECQPARLPVAAGASVTVECRALATEGDEVVLLGASWFTSMNDTLPEAHSRYYVNLTGDDVEANVFVYPDGVIVFDPADRLVGADRARS